MHVESSSSSSDIPRKRPRSQTESTQEPATTYKRGASEDQVIRSDLETPEHLANAMADIDAYMADQGEQDPTPLNDVAQSISTNHQSGPSGFSVSLPHQQLTSVQALKMKPLVEGDIWFLISKSWYTRWENACTGRVSKSSSTPTPIGPIDNSDIVSTSPFSGKLYDLILEPPVVEGETAEFVPKLAHDFFRGMVRHVSTTLSF